MSKLTAYCALYARQENPVEGTPYYELAQRWPNAACHDGFNVLFRTTSDDEQHYQLLSDIAPVTPDSTEDARAWALARVLIDPERPAIYGPLSAWSGLFKHRLYRLYCAQFTEAEDYQDCVRYVAGTAPSSEQWESEMLGIDHTDRAAIQACMADFIRSHVEATP